MKAHTQVIFSVVTTIFFIEAMACYEWHINTTFFVSDGVIKSGVANPFLY